MSAKAAVRSKMSFSVGTKILAIVGVVLGLLIAVAVVGGLQMQKIGREITEIAEEDIPLTTAVTSVTIHQLEQALALERALRFGEEMVTHEAAKEHFATSVREFEELSEKVNREIEEAEAVVEHNLVIATSEEAIEEFESVGRALKQIESEHQDFERHAIEVLEFLAAGEIESAIALEDALAAEEAQLDHELVALLEELEAFTQASAVTAEAHEKTGLLIMIVMAVSSLIVGAAISLVMIRQSITRPLSEVVTALRALTDGDTSVSVKVRSDDEIGEVAKAVETFREKTIEIDEMRARQEKEQAEEQARAKRVQELSTAFEGKVSESLGAVNAAASQMQSTAESMSSTAEETNRQASAVASASEEAAANVQTVASAAEELASSVAEVNIQVVESSRMSQEAQEKAETTNEQIKGLAEASQKIGEVIDLINDIASQTNLLALNATIEAARAGDAGKGFAVVASEVKSLANETAKATDEIASQVSNIQEETRQAVKAMETIGEVVSKINQNSTRIAAAVEEQTAATSEITRSAQEASKGTTEVSSNISGVSEAANETGKASTQVLEVAGDVATHSTSMGHQVESFLTSIKAA